MNEKISILIDEAIREYYEDYANNNMTDVGRQVIRSRIINKVKIKIKEDMKIDLLNHPDSGLIAQITDEVDEKLKLKKHLEEDTPVEEIEKEPEEKEEEQKGEEPTLEETKEDPEKEEAKEAEEEVKEEFEDKEEIDLKDKDVYEMIRTFEIEIKEVNKLEQSGEHAKATARSGRLIRQLRNKISELKSEFDVNAKDLEILEQIEVFLDDQIEWHKNQLKKRYKNEFSEQKATFKAIFTVLPKGIALQAKRVINCIDQLREAKSNKERIFGILELGKQIGVLALTPVIFTAKFIIKHWYLLLLLLLLLKLPSFNFGKNPQEQENHDLNPEPEVETVVEPGVEHVPEPAPAPAPAPAPVVDPAPEKPVPSPVFTADDQRQEQIDLIKQQARERSEELARQHQQQIAEDLTGDQQRQEQIDLIKQQARERSEELARQHQQQIAEDLTTEQQRQEQQEIIRHTQETVQHTTEQVVQTTAEQQEIIEKVTNDFIDNLEKNYNFFIASRHPETLIVHNAEEYIEAVHNVNPGVKITVDNAADIYAKNFSSYASSVDKPIIWPEADSYCRYFASEADLANYITSGEDQMLNDYYYDFINNGGNVGLLKELSNVFDGSAIAQTLESVGISGTGAVFLFCLYELAQYGLAAPTGGLSLLAPG